MSDFTENTRVQVPAAIHICKLGYTYLDDIKESDFDDKTNILIKVFYESLKRLNPGLTDIQCKQELESIVSMLDNDDLGRKFYERLSANHGIKWIDYENPNNNSWHVTTEFSCSDKESGESFRPDITCFINGLPLAFIEVKKPNNREGILKERERIDYRFQRREFRRFLNITQLMIFSNNQEYEEDSSVPVQGSFYCCTAKEHAFFNVFREEVKNFVEEYPYLQISEDVIQKVLHHRNCEVIRVLPEFQTNSEVNTPTNRIITSLLCKERILFLLRYGFTYVNRTLENKEGLYKKLEKHIMRYQQLFALLDIRKMLDNGVKGGIIWHTQGSGKTELAYYSVKNLKDYFAKKDTAVKFYFIVDRIDLMEQASDEFSSRGLIVQNAGSREELMADLRNNNLMENNEGKDEITVVNIQKFEEDKKKINLPDDYNIHLQRVFFIDEAHRGYNPTGSFLANLLEADKNAIKIALTGTPLLKAERESWRVFGNYINVYYYDKSIADGYTRKLMREPIETEYREKLKDILDKLTGEVKVNKSDIDTDKILENDNYLNALLDYIIKDFREFRIAQADDTVGAMIVCRTNPQARELYRLWSERYENALNEQMREDEQMDDRIVDPMIEYHKKKFKPLKAALILHDEGDKEERKDYIDGFKKTRSIDVLIVNKMLLTGFDAPRLKKLYLGRKMDGHELLQALTRVNRPYRDFNYGYVVDFVDIKENFEETNNRYLQELNKTQDEPFEGHNIGETVLENPEVIKDKIDKVEDDLFIYTINNKEQFRREIDEIEDPKVLYALRNSLTTAKELQNQIRIAGNQEIRDKFNKLDLGSIPALITEVSHRIDHINLMNSQDHKADVSEIINLALDELEFTFKKGTPEELKIVINDLRDRARKVQMEFEANFDHDEVKYVVLSEQFRKYFREHGFTPSSIAEVKACIGYMDEVMKKIREINRRNNALKAK
jgi:type I restriction enzyme R subunit